MTINYMCAGDSKYMKYGKAAAAGAAVYYAKLDTALASVGLPPAVHYAAAGAAIDIYCRGLGAATASPTETALCALAGFAGAYVLSKF